MSKCNEVKETPPPSTNHKKSAARLPTYFLQNSGWFMVQYLSQGESTASVYQAKKKQKMRAFSYQCKLMSVILLLPPHPVSVPGSQKALSITGIRKHSFSQRLCTIVSASCPCGRHNFLTPVDYRMGIQYLLKSLCQDTLISNPWRSYYTS